nr:MAG TPA: Growth/differentiation factor 11 morphogenetic protein 11, BMP-11 [Caudoviricetes sp.]
MHAVPFSDCRPLFCLLSPRSFAFLSCKGKC